MKKSIVFTLTVAICVFLNGCTTAVHLRNDMEDSKVAYKTCLDNHPNNLDACEKEKRIFEADKEAYQSINHQ